MKVVKKENKLYFNEDDKSFINITLNEENKSAFIELVKVLPKHRNCKLATQLMKKVLQYIKSLGYKLIELSPLPLDLSGPNIEQLMLFYTKFSFIKCNNSNTTNPYLMCKHI